MAAKMGGQPLKTLTSSDKKSSLCRFSKATIAFGAFPEFLSLAITVLGGPEGSFRFAIIAFGALEFILPQIRLSLRKKEKTSLDSLF